MLDLRRLFEPIATPLSEAMARFGRRRPQPRMRRRLTDARRYEVVIGGARLALRNLSKDGFAAEGAVDRAPRRAIATILKDGDALRRGEAALIWRDGDVAGFRFLQVAEG